MKTRKAVIVLVMAGLLTSLLAGGAIAATYTCTVESAGPWGVNPEAGGAYVVYLTDTAASPAFTNKKCTFPNNATTGLRGKEYLAAALTALANGKTVTVTTASAPSSASLALTSFLVNK
jgi:hypothetical protein